MTSYNLLPFDTEYSRSKEAKMNVVCLSAGDFSSWTNRYRGKGITETQKFFNDLPSDTIILSFAAEAEASAMISIDIDPLKFKWIDLQLEVKMLYNHNRALTTGLHLIDGKEKYLKPFGEKPQTSLAASLFRFLKVKIDTDHKDKMRDIIISDDDELIEANKEAIMEYCKEDTKYLIPLYNEIRKWQLKTVPKKYQDTLMEEMLARGEYSARTAVMVRHGLPINVEWARNLASNVPNALMECIEDINSQFEKKPFKWDKSKNRYSKDTKVWKEWIIANGYEKMWKKTDTNGLSLALEAWEDLFSFRHDFPRGNFGAQIVRYLKLEQNLRSFNISGDKANFFDSVGSDGYSRPYMNHFGSQSSRTQPKSTGFLFLKSAWMRVLCQPPKGYAIGAIDYASQEFLLSAVCSQDRKMIDAYAEGDVYLYYGKGIGLIPQDGTRSTHKAERDLCKATVLGLSYLMTKVGLSKKLTVDTGRYVSEEEADSLVMKFDRLFNTFSRWRESCIQFYATAKYLRLPDGWFMFGDNNNHRSAANFPLQGAGACIMRKAVALAQDRGLTVVQTLHDALYIMSPSDKIADDMDLLGECMREAFCFYFEGQAKEDAKIIRLDYKAWGPDLEDGEITTKLKNKLETSKIFIDERGEKEYSSFNKFFKESSGIELL